MFAGCKEYEEFGRVQVTEDVNAVVWGLRNAGAREIRVVDFHGSGGPSKYVISKKLEKGVKLFHGSDLPGRLEKAVDKSTAAAVFVGFHAMADTKDGFLRHTITMDPRIMINGKPVGETAINAYALAEHGIPVIMVTGDQALAREAEAFIPGVETGQVKTSIECKTTRCLPLSKARKLIEAAAERVFERIEGFKPVQVTKLIRLDVSFPNREQAELCKTIPKVNVRAKTVSYVADCWEEADKFIKTTLSLANEFHIQKLVNMLSKLEGARALKRAPTICIYLQVQSILQKVTRSKMPIRARCFTFDSGSALSRKTLLFSGKGQGYRMKRKEDATTYSVRHLDV